MKHLHLVFEDKEFDFLKKVKQDMGWREFILKSALSREGKDQKNN
jgi:hypothetical protein